MSKRLVQGRTESLPASEWLARMVSPNSQEPTPSVNVGMGTPYFISGRCTREQVAEMLAERELDVTVLKGKVLISGSKLVGERPIVSHAEHLVRLANPALAQLEAEEDLPPVKRDMRYRSHFQQWVEREQLAGASVVVGGDRAFAKPEVIREHIATLPQGTVIIEGESPGAPSLAADVALEQGLPVAGFPPRWEINANTPPQRIGKASNGRPYDKAATVIRNGRMVECGPEAIVVFADSPDASPDVIDLIARGLRLDIPVELVRSDGSRELLLSRTANAE